MHIGSPPDRQWTPTPRIDVDGGLEARIAGRRTTRPHTPAVSSSSVTISAEADALSRAGDRSSATSADGLRDQISKIDFHHTTQAELGNLVSSLVRSHELTPDQAAPFISAATDVVPPRGPDDAFDLAKHFETVKGILDSGARTDPSLRWGAAYAGSEIDVLHQLQSFATSSRLHVMSST